MELCWLCREYKKDTIKIKYTDFNVCKECYDHYEGKIKQCVGYSGRECSMPVLGERVDEGHVRCEECQEHFWDENPDAPYDEE